ncbi:MAG TPA: HD-GYP domain-containing protein [Gaiellaceae bacterium]|jgi:putative nucleotidyltransferase with HDIG domain|nr:HD-GYP domain-containing protein [Gaiellaceae bacterium]
MRLSTSDRLAPILVVGGALAAFPTAAGHFLGGNQVAFGGGVHFYGVGMTALAAAAAAVALTVMGARRRDGRTVLLGTAFSVMAALLSLHGIATPYFLVGMNGVVAFTGGATLPIGGAILALSAIPRFRRADGVRSLLILQASLLVLIAAMGVTAFSAPDLVPSVPEARSPAALALLAVGLGFYALLAYRAFRTFMLTHRHADLLVVVGIAWLAAALPPAMLMTYMELGWWLGHGFELIGLVLVALPVALDLRRGAQSRPLAGDLATVELVRSEEEFLGSHVRALMVSLAEKDEYTEGHSRRVALRAVQVGEELGLSPLRLRELATGGLVHDIGKLSVPNSILKKPGRLSDREFDVIKRHPEIGFRMLLDLGFSKGVAQVVLDHHERLDGTGYPRGLSGPAMTLEARILAVCDVYDALVSNRVYRDAFSHESALEILREEAGTKLDRRCVVALIGVTAEERAPEAVAV